MSKFKIYDEDDNFIGEYIGEFVEDAKDNVSESFGDSFGAGCFAMLILVVLKFPWLIIVLIFWSVLKVIGVCIKFIARVFWWLFRFFLFAFWWILQEIVYGVWWLIGVPITLILDRNVPYWWFPEWRFTEW